MGKKKCMLRLMTMGVIVSLSLSACGNSVSEKKEPQTQMVESTPAPAPEAPTEPDTTKQELTI